MFCQGCGTQLQAGLSYCNRCGANLKEGRGFTGVMLGALLAAITIIALGGLGIMLGGAVVLTKEALFRPDAVAYFMTMTFLIVVLVEIFLCRQLSRLSGESQQRKLSSTKPSKEIPSIQTPLLNEPMGSVIENTTRTLDYAHIDTRR